MSAGSPKFVNVYCPMCGAPWEFWYVQREDGTAEALLDKSHGVVRTDRGLFQCARCGTYASLP